MSYVVKVHVRDGKFESRSLCGQPWKSTTRGGRVCSDTEPPYVVDESKRRSVNPATCAKCLELWRKSLSGC